MPLPEKSTRYLKIKKYYINNIPNCISLFAAWWFALWMTMDDESYFIYLLFVLISLSLFPLSKLLIESVALKYTTREFWNRGFFLDTSGKTGLLAAYNLLCLAVAIPLGVMYIVYIRMKKE